MKKIKYLVVALVLGIVFLGSTRSYAADSANSSSGKAYIPMFYTSSADKCLYDIANITDNAISVTVTMYAYDGTLVTDDGSKTTGKITTSSNVSDYNDANTTSTLSFTIGAHCSAQFYINNSTSSSFGYGLISWSQNSSVVQGLVAQGSYYNSSNSRFAIIINGGMPF